MSHNPLLNIILDDGTENQLELIPILAAMEEERVQKQRSSSSRRGSVVGHTPVNRDYILSHERLFQDYFTQSPVYNAKLFGRRFRMSRSFFLRIQSKVESHDRYFVQKEEIVLEFLACLHFERLPLHSGCLLMDTSPCKLQIILM